MILNVCSCIGVAVYFFKSFGSLVDSLTGLDS